MFSFADEVSYIKSAWKHAPAFKDSTVIKTFQRNKWKHATVVCDFTGSMAPYIAQTLIWYKLTFQTKDISEFVFFNDGDETPNYKKKIGKTGGFNDKKELELFLVEELKTGYKTELNFD
ncbi:MAG: hypothetical protein JST67_05315 [Bacteroidetes bacterium]|nr:hypothetical protein [Bacteroidota bacterium]